MSFTLSKEISLRVDISASPQLTVCIKVVLDGSLDYMIENLVTITQFLGTFRYTGLAVVRTQVGSRICVMLHVTAKGVALKMQR